jgi:hypothetical protein
MPDMSASHRLSIAIAVVTLAPALYAQHPATPAGMTHEEHLAQMQKEADRKAHGQRAMGFDQDATTHHFGLTIDGGSIAVAAKGPGDRAGRDQIRAHLKEIAVAFTHGDFGKPLETHGEQPPGVLVLQRLKQDVSYAYEDTAQGGIVRITTANPDALVAVHAFLRYQITEHATGDPLTVQTARSQGGWRLTPAADSRILEACCC